MTTSLRTALGILTLVAMTACTPAKPHRLGDPQSPYPPSREPVLGDVLHLPTGFYVSEAQMLAAAGDARVVYVGETHDNPASHRLELTVLKALYARYPGRVALGMEMFTTGQQEVLNRWVTGELSEKEFLKTSRWFDVWNMDFAYYRDLLVFARDNGIPVMGLNASKELVRSVGQTDFADLPDADKKLLPEIDMSDPYHTAMVKAIFGGHTKGNNMLDGFLRVQNLWDETMAENVARFLKSKQGDEPWHMVVVAGGNHIRFGFGIPRRVFRRIPTSYALIGSREINIPESKKDRLMDVEMPEFPMVPYDYLVFTEYEDLPHKEVRLGVMLDDSKGQVVLEMVAPGSTAADAGLKKGDVILTFGGVAIKENFDLVYEVKQRKAGDTVKLDIERDQTPMSLTVTFKESAANGHHPPK